MELGWINRPLSGYYDKPLPLTKEDLAGMKAEEILLSLGD